MSNRLPPRHSYLARHYLLLTTIFLLVACNLMAEATQKGRILILYAFHPEGLAIEEQMSVNRVDTLLGRPVLSGQLAGKDVVVAESGVGMTNASMMTQLLIDSLKPSCLLFTGIAGAIDSKVNIGDIVICNRWATHDYVYFGPDSLRPRPIQCYAKALDSIVSGKYFSVDSTFFLVATNTAQKDITLKTINSRAPKIVIGGTGVSGNSFIDCKEKRNWLQLHFDARVTDMESAAVAQVCTANGTPFIIFRSSSDLAGGSDRSTANEEIERFFEIAAFNSAAVVAQFIEEM